SQADADGNAVHRALPLVMVADRGDAPSVGQALLALDSAAGPGQPEILKDLRAEPANLTDADQRLQALCTALQASVDTPDPERAREQLTTILSMPRYVGLATGAPLWVRIVEAVGDALGRFLNWLGVGNLNVPLWLWLGVGALMILGSSLWPIRGGLGRGGGEAVPRSAPSLT